MKNSLYTFVQNLCRGIAREEGPGKADKKMASAKQKDERSDRGRVVRAHWSGLFAGCAIMEC